VKDVQVRDVVEEVTPPPPGSFCALGGSRVSTAGTTLVIPTDAGVVEPDLSFVNLPDGFCVHYFATIPTARAIRFAPGGELFVASPTQPVAGGAPQGPGAIFVVPDDNGDGYGDTPVTFQDNLPATQGMLFTTGAFYYQDHTSVMAVPYVSGERVNMATPTQMVDINVFISGTHWPKTLDVADDGTIYVTNGSDQSEQCVTPHVFHGGVLAIDGSPNGKEIAQGFRNPIYVRCQRGHDNCFVDELTLDGSGSGGGREKLVRFASGQDWGFPCCSTQNAAFPGIEPEPDCSGVEADIDSFKVSNTPFGLDFEPGLWPAPYTNDGFIAMHGAFASWTGARIVAIQTDPNTGLALPASNLDGSDTGGMSDFLTGYDDETQSHGRPADITFAKDGRMFIANDANGVIMWVAPVTLQAP
jgi:glucose/arabinose dehydrogenase